MATQEQRLTDAFQLIGTDIKNILNALWSKTGNAGTDPATHFIGTTDNQPLIFRTNNVERFRILGNGNFGIGTTSPTNTLDVIGGFSLRNTQGAQGTNYGIEFNTNSNSPRIDWVYNGNYTGSFAGDADFFFRLQNSRVGAGGFRFVTNQGSGGVSRLSILNNGNVLINTTTDAGFRLNVNGNASFVATGALATDIGLMVRNSANTFNILEVRGNGDIEIRSNRVSLARSRRINLGGNNIDNAPDSTAYDEIVMLGYNNTNANFRATILGSSNTCALGGSPSLILGYGNNSTTGGNIFIGRSNTGQASIIFGTNNSANGGGSGSGIVCIGHSNTISVPNGFPTLPMFLIGTSLTLPNSSATNNCVFLSAGSNNGNPFVTIKNDNLLLGSLTPWVSNFDNNSRGVFYTKNGITPNTLPIDSIALYSADIVEGNAAPHFRTELGHVIKLYRQDLPTNPTNAEIATLLSNVGLANLI